jgi:hypothetical protein
MDWTIAHRRIAWLLAVCTLQVAILGLSPLSASAQITLMPLSAAPDPSQDDDLGPEVPATMTPIPAGTIDPFAGYGYNPAPGAYSGGLVGPGEYQPVQPVYDTGWKWQMFPHGWMYPTYLASQRESRMGATFFNEQDEGWLVDVAVGGRAGLLRWGTDDLLRPEGFQLDLEGAVLPRFRLDSSREFVSADFRGGFPLTFRRGPVEAKLSYYHYSSHLGDMYIQNHPGATQTPYTRDAVVLGVGLRPVENFRVYVEADYAFHTNGNPDPWQFQFGVDWSTLKMTGPRGAPFFAVNSMIREDVHFGGNLTVQTGWQWRGQAGQSLRTGVHYFNGKSNQGQFFNNFEQQIGVGLWYDF